MIRCFNLLLAGLLMDGTLPKVASLVLVYCWVELGCIAFVVGFLSSKCFGATFWASWVE
jgi:hypothetical protein